MPELTASQLSADITKLYELGYIAHLKEEFDDPKNCSSVEFLREFLRESGYTNEQINARDYR